MDERLIEAGIELGDTRAIKIALQRKGYRPSLLLKGPHDRIRFECEKGGKGIGCTHIFEATPMEALNGEGCPHCKLIDYIENAPPPEVTEKEMAEAIRAQHKSIAAGILRSKKKQRRSANNYGLPKYLGL